MNHLRRYLPFTALIAVQLFVLFLAPSKPVTSSGPALGGTFNGSSPTASSTGVGSSLPTVAGTGKTGTTGTTGTGTTPGTTGTSGDTTSNTGTTGTGSNANSSPGTSNSGGGTPSSSSAAKAASFCVTGLEEHIPCINTAAYSSNGGATDAGVTAKTITIVMYRTDENPAVDAITKSTGTYISPAAEKQMIGVIEKWVNTHEVEGLYGRQVKFDYVQGTCSTTNASDSCFRTEADSIVAKYHPFALMWDDDSSEGAFFDELARKGVISWGGWGFSDAFDDSLRPYHYDVFTGGDLQAELAGEFWCNDLEGQKAEYAGPLLKNDTRKVAVIYPDDPDTEPAAKHLESIINGCDKNGAFDSPYSSNTATAAAQSTAVTAKLKAAGVTSLIYMSDPIAPAFLTTTQNTQDYQPEEILAGGGLVDYDALAQTYNQNVWKHAFGLSDRTAQPPIADVDAGKIWTQEHEAGSPNAASELMTNYALLLIQGITLAGPDLTALNYEAGMLTFPGYDGWSQDHNPNLNFIQFGKGDYTANSDVRIVYWNPNGTSENNGKKGTYVSLNGGERYVLGQLPKSVTFPSTV